MQEEEKLKPLLKGMQEAIHSKLANWYSRELALDLSKESIKFEINKFNHW